MYENLFYHPYLKKRDDKSRPKINKYFGFRDDCFDEFEGITFHFFTDDYGRVKDIVWKVVLLKNNITITNLDEKLTDFIGINYLYNSVLNLVTYNFRLQYIVFYDVDDWSKEKQNVYVIDYFIRNGELCSSYTKLNRDEFEDLVYKTQGHSMIMNKPLIYSTTELEGYLSDLCQKGNNFNKKAIFPGDVDLVIFDRNIAKYLLEFKKHTISGPIVNQSFLKYWYMDKKKYSGLASLTKRFGLKIFYNIIYSTFQDDNSIKIEMITPDLNLYKDGIITFNSKNDLVQKLHNIFR